MRKKIVHVGCAAILILLECSFFEANSGWCGDPLADSQMAIQRGMDYLGISKGYDTATIFKRAISTLERTETQHLTLFPDKSVDTAVWRIEFKNIRLPETNQRSRDFQVWIGAESGKLLRIYSPNPDFMGKNEYLPFYYSLEPRLPLGIGLNCIDIADSLPKFRLLDIIWKSVAQPFDRGEITVYYLSHARAGTFSPVWITDVGGIPPLGPNGRGNANDYNINHLLKMFDANTGNGFYGEYYTAPLPRGEK